MLDDYPEPFSRCLQRSVNFKSKIWCPQFSQKMNTHEKIILSTTGPQDNYVCWFFGRIEDTINCFRDFLTFKIKILAGTKLLRLPWVFLVTARIMFSSSNCNFFSLLYLQKTHKKTQFPFWGVFLYISLPESRQRADTYHKHVETAQV